MGALGLDAWGLAVQLVAFIVFIVSSGGTRWAQSPTCSTSDRSGSRRAWPPRTRCGRSSPRRRSATRKSWSRRAGRHSRSSPRHARSAMPPWRGRRRKRANRPRLIWRALQATLRQETEQARLQLRQELADLAVMAAGRIVKKARSRRAVPSHRGDPGSEAATTARRRGAKGRGGEGRPVASSAAKRYAQAIFTLGKERGHARHLAVRTWPCSLARRRRHGSRLSDESQCRRGAKIEALESSLNINVQTEARNLARMLIERNRTMLIPQIRRYSTINCGRSGASRSLR